jgi:hypothetical protein
MGDGPKHYHQALNQITDTKKPPKGGFLVSVVNK